MSSSHSLTTFRYSPSDNTYISKTSIRALGAHEVLIKTTHSGLCFTDVHAKRSGCGLGHEGVGIIQATGSLVSAHAVGDRVGWGWLHDSCGYCKPCVTGYRQYCAKARGFGYGEKEQGALGDFAIWNEDFVYAIPLEIGSVHAGPLMCAGASVYEALDAAGTKAGDRVGVVGIGGLGHVAVLFARAMGCGVTAISMTEGKRKDAAELGADRFGRLDKTIQSEEEEWTYITQDEGEDGINVLLICTNEVPDLTPLLPQLARQATIVPMTIQTRPMVVPFMPFILPGHKIIASTEASRKNHIEMLRFVARHNIKPWIEQFPMTKHGIAEAFERLEGGKMRYRGVLVAEK